MSAAWIPRAAILPSCDGVDDFAAAAQAVAAGEEPGDAGGAGGGIDHDSSLGRTSSPGKAATRSSSGSWPSAFTTMSAGMTKLEPATRLHAARSRIGLVELGPQELDASRDAAVAEDADRLGEPLEADAVGPGELVFVGESRNQRLGAPVGDRHGLGPEPLGGGGHVDRRVAGADHHHMSRRRCTR